MKNLIILVVLLMGALAACNQDKVVEPKADIDLNSAELLEFDEPDDSGGARVAAEAIPAANAVYQVFQVAGSCETGKARLAIYTGYADILADGLTLLPDALVKTSAGFKKVTVKSAKYNTYLKVKLDKTHPYTFLMYVPETKAWQILTGINANAEQFGFINYYRWYYRFNCDEAAYLPLFTLQT